VIAAIAANLDLAPDQTVASRTACYVHERIQARRRGSRRQGASALAACNTNHSTVVF